MQGSIPIVLLADYGLKFFQARKRMLLRTQQEPELGKKYALIQKQSAQMSIIKICPIFEPSKPVGEFQHVKIRRRVVMSVDPCIGLVQIPVAHPQPFEERNTNARGQGKLEVSAVVLRSKAMPAKQSPASSHI